MNPDNHVCQFYLQKSCRFGDKCYNRHEKPSYSNSKHQQVHQNDQQTLTNKSIAHSPLNSVKNINEIYPKKSSTQDLLQLRNKNKKLVKKINLLETSVNTLSNQLKWQERNNTKFIDEFNMMRLNDEDYKCIICLRVFIRPILLGCSHMFCELCIDRWIVDNQNCPTCDNSIVNRAYCLSVDNFIKKIKEKIPEDKINKKFNKSEESQAEDKPKSKTNDINDNDDVFYKCIFILIPIIVIFNNYFLP